MENAQLAANKMDIYRAKLEVIAEIEAFNQEDAQEYIKDIFGVDEEIKSVKIIQIVEKNS